MPAGRWPFSRRAKYPKLIRISPDELTAAIPQAGKIIEG
jgi:hypothetical protein